MGKWYERVAVARPFLRWVGGKQAFVARLGDLIPPVAGTYFEPFLGSGAVFFYLQRRLGRPLEAVLGDSNLQLIQAYDAVRSDPDGLHQRLTALQDEYDSAADRSKFFYRVRDEYNDELPATDAAKFIFLNRTCWNGLYRVNQQGRFNVPYGRPKSDQVIPELSELLNGGAALVRAKLRATSWENTVAKAKAGDFVFLDPPYYSDVEKDDRKYRSRDFTLAHHERLAGRLRQLADRGVDFLLTNSAEPIMAELYASHDLTVNLVEMPRSISTKVNERAPAEELVVTPLGDEAQGKHRGAVLERFHARRIKVAEVEPLSTADAVSLQVVSAEG